MPAAGLEIRALLRSERAAWEPLWQAYLDFYRSAVAPGNNDVLWARIHDPAEPVFALGAYRDGRLIGIAHYIFHRSCWTVGDYCYLQDLFVAADARGGGVGRALIAAVEQAARAKGASRIHWLTQEDNHSARALYDKVAERSGFIQYRKIF
ncbi:MAG: GNAT family N-acetyltransferase [Pseudorhodoplanes sp.]|nr:GNAT family N-acetyltransferase [Pseudorhodoplanes sp.]MCL4712556.1 GNAT family N-acetyltransferase [Pseudorhodoplanes sp.]MCQ3943630.1 GNAT family N-acetyltransferase [Alphaproteobacteria bacterium]GIK78928.1 MAG: N-acetyltransferase [Alphaproteobacteria bacterium]